MSTVGEDENENEGSINDVDNFETNMKPKPKNSKFLGMTAIERMFLAFFFLLNVLALGFAILIVTGRLSF
ncbi:MAG: hypothetical protein ACOYLB_03050 [Phototrophicaceae bacterium]